VLRRMWQRMARKRWAAVGGYWPKPHVRAEGAARHADSVQWQKDEAERSRRAPWTNAEQVFLRWLPRSPRGCRSVPSGVGGLLSGCWPKKPSGSEDLDAKPVR